MTTLSDIRYICERNVEGTLDNDQVVNWCNLANSEFNLRLFIPGSTTLDVTTSDLTYTLSTSIRQIRRIRSQTDLNNGINREIYPVYTFYNGKFEVPTAFSTADTLLIDYYAYLTVFTDIANNIDLADRYKEFYTSYVEMKYHMLPSVHEKLGSLADIKYQSASTLHAIIRKQVADFYVIDNGIEKPQESGW